MALPNEDLWGLNPQTGNLYTVAERRQMMDSRGGPSRFIGGPAPSMMWDEWFDRVNTASSGLPEGFRAPVQNNQIDPAFEGLNNALIKQAAGRRATAGGRGGMTRNIARDPESTWNFNEAGPRPWGEAAMKGLKGY